MSVLVSIIIPVYNTELNYLEQCIESIKNQSFSDYEIVIIDDCSTKIETLSYLDSLIDESIKVIHLNNNQGISNARNAGIENATGEWICFVDHDDYWEEDYLLRMVNACKNAKTDMVVSGYQVVDV
jgi:glycosyltransferase involved in cell wall biosynthesis